MSSKKRSLFKWIVAVCVLAAAGAGLWHTGWHGVARALGLAAEQPETRDDAPDVFKIRGDSIEVPEAAARTMKLETAVTVPRRVPVTLRLTGRTGLNMESVAHVRGQFPGRVLNIGPALGTFVHGPEDSKQFGSPTVMCVVESTDLAQAKSDFVKAKVTMEVDEDALRRTKELVDAKVLADKFLLDAESAVKKDRADYDAARQKLLVFGLKDADLPAIDRQQGRERMVYNLVCPKSGIITEKNVVRGELADPTVNLFTIADLSKIWVWGDVYERDRRRVKEGQKMKVIVASHPDEPRECTVEWVSPVLDSATRSIRIRGSIDNRDGRLLADMYCSIILQIEEPADSIILPSEAVVRKEDAAFVFVRTGTREGSAIYERRPVRVEPVASGIGFETAATTAPLLSGGTSAADDAVETAKSIDGRRARRSGPRGRRRRRRRDSRHPQRPGAVPGDGRPQRRAAGTDEGQRQRTVATGGRRRAAGVSMIKKLIDFALDNRLVTVGLILVFVLYGVFAFRQVPIEAFPDPDDVHVQVIMLWPGQAAEEIESQVTRPTEQQLNGTAGLSALRSVSMFGLSVVTCTFEDSVTDATARAAVLEKMQGVQLPTAAQWQLAPLTTSTGEIFRYVVKGPREKLQELRALEDWVVEPQIRQVDGVADVNAFGGGIKQYQVVVRPELLLQQKVTLAQVFTALQNNNANTGGNVLRTGEQMLVIRGVGALNDASDRQNLANIRSIWITNQDGHPVYIRDVADVQTGMAPRQGVVGWYRRGESATRPAPDVEPQIVRSGEARAAEPGPAPLETAGARPPAAPARAQEIDDVVEAIVVQRKGTNALNVLQGIRDKVAFLNEKVLKDRGVTIVPIYDRGDLVHQTVHTVMHNLIEGAILILIISLIFTGSLRAAVIICLVIPLSLLTAFLVLHLYGVPANLLSFGAVDFGILVDAAVVIVEAILVQKILAPPDADFREVTRRTSESLGRPMLFAKVIFIVSLVPIFTFQRVEGRIFRPMALTITGAMVGATLMTFTLVPLAASFLLRGVKARRENVLARGLRAGYGWLMGYVLRFKVGTVVIALAVLALTVAWGANLGTEFLPKLDEGNIWLSVDMPLSVSKDKAKENERRIREVLRSFPESRQIYTQLGRPDDGTDAKGFNNLEIGIDLVPREQWVTRGPDGSVVDKEGLIKQMNDKLQELPGLEFNFSQVIEDNVEEALSGVKGELAIKLFGDDLKVLQQKGEEIRQVLAQVRGNADLAVEKLSGQPNLTIQLEREGLARYGVDVQTALNFVQTGLGGQSAGSVLEGQRRFDLSVRLSESARSSVNRIADLWIDTPAGQRIPITQLATVKTEEGASRIGRDNNSRRVALKCGIRDRDMGSFVADAREQVESKVKLPPGYFLTWEGQFENQERATARLKVIVPLSLLCVFVILAWAFQRVRYAGLILANIPFAFVGSLAALHFTHTHLSVSAMIGFIALSGVSVQNGIVLVGQFNLLRHQGMPLPQAVLEGARHRVRPVLMTALMAAIGMYPAAVSTGIGSEVQRPLALVIVGGMLSAAVLTLVVLPVLYELFETWFPAPVTVPEGLID